LAFSRWDRAKPPPANRHSLKWQLIVGGTPDRDIALKASVSRALVKAVRTELSSAGELPKYERPEGGTVRTDAYKPGASARGGYVYDDKGNVVREVDWVLTHGRGRKRAETSG
jgi:hypothetical protein